MYQRKAKPSWQVIDGKMIYLDSMMEAKIINRLIKSGFSKKWRRTLSGLASGSSHYTPDIELSINHDGMNRRAIVEFKPNNTAEFTIDRRAAMLASSRYYKDALCLLYIERTKQWYLIEPTLQLQKIPSPTPGGVEIGILSRPRLSVPVLLTYGRIYRSRPLAAIGTITAHGLEFGVSSLFGHNKRRK
jgi:hypothetical protein